MTDLLTCPEVAAELGVADETVRAWVRNEKIAHVLLPSGQPRIPRSEGDRILTIKAAR